MSNMKENKYWNYENKYECGFAILGRADGRKNMRGDHWSFPSYLSAIAIINRHYLDSRAIISIVLLIILWIFDAHNVKTTRIQFLKCFRKFSG